MKKLFLLFHGRFPGEKAASLFAAKSAEAFAKAGIEVEVIVPKRKGVDAQNAYAYFSVEHNFKITELSTIDIFGGPSAKFAFWLSFIAFSFSCRSFLKKNLHEGDIVYSNESLPLYAASFITDRVFYEMHDFPESKLGLFSIFLKRMKWLLVHNNWKTQKLHEVFKISAECVITEPNAVSIETFDISISKEDARAKLGLPLDKKLIVYTGALFGWKGVHTLAEAAKYLPQDFIVAFVGGALKDIEVCKKAYRERKEILILGHRPHKEMPLWQKAADVLVLPNTAKEAISLYYTSPMKLFEYMASGRAIVASDIPSIRELADDSSVLFVPADDAKALATGIVKAMDESQETKSRMSRARVGVEDHTWDKRAQRILSFIKNHA